MHTCTNAGPQPDKVLRWPKTAPQQGARVQGFGLLLSFAGGIAAGKGTAALIGASFVGPVGFVVGVGISIAWNVWAAPWIYDNIGATPTRNLAPLVK